MMSSSSISYGESVLSHLEKVQELSAEVQTDIAKRVGTYLTIARAAKSEAILQQIASSAAQEQAKAIGKGVHWQRGPYNGPAMGWTGTCRGLVLCHDEPVKGIPRSIARGSDHRSN